MFPLKSHVAFLRRLFVKLSEACIWDEKAVPMGDGDAALSVPVRASFSRLLSDWFSCKVIRNMMLTKRNRGGGDIVDDAEPAEEIGQRTWSRAKGGRGNMRNFTLVGFSVAEEVNPAPRKIQGRGCPRGDRDRGSCRHKSAGRKQVSDKQ